MAELLGDCAEDLEIAKRIRVLVLIPVFSLLKTCAKTDISDYIDGVELEFTGINYTTKGFIHELLGKLICEFGEWVCDYVIYKCANRNVYRVILKSLETMPQASKNICCD